MSIDKGLLYVMDIRQMMILWNISDEDVQQDMAFRFQETVKSGVPSRIGQSYFVF